MKKLIYEIKQESNKLRVKSDEDFKITIKKVKARKQKEPLKNLIVEWFALVQEASSRALGLRHFDTQLLAGLLLHEGKIVEMKTGEGKTLVSTLPISLNALSDRGAHVVTVNDYLAERDQKWMGKIYNKLDLTVGLVKSTSTLLEKQKSYGSDITYVTNSELVFDFLRDSSAYNLNEIVQRQFNFCLIDEIDSVLIDEARTPLILSTFRETADTNKLYLAQAVAAGLEKDLHFQLDEKRKDIHLTEIGYKEAKTRLGKKTLYDRDDPWILNILNALKAKYFFHLNKDYIVLNNKVIIVDEFTGRIMEDRRWSAGLHESVEIKEKVLIGGRTETKNSITYQNFFTLYPILSGMSGTAKTTEKEFKDIYNLDVIVLPTVKPLIRQDLPDFVYQTEAAKWKNVLSLSKKCFEKGQPVLIGTSTIGKSEFLSDLFKASNIPHKLLNAQPENVAHENEIVAQAGERFAVTIATNMAGRGTDIILGGNPSFKIKQELYEALIEKKEILYEDIWKDYLSEDLLKKDIDSLPYSLDYCKDSLKNLYTIFKEKILPDWEFENNLVKALGGLFVLGTERHETRRIDNQLRGRSGRQGDPGISQFFVSLEDDLFKVFGGENIRKFVSFLVQDKDAPLESNLLTKCLENAQKKVELYTYLLRKNLFEYDDILNIQREQLFNARKKLLLENLHDNLLLRYSENTFDESLKRKVNIPSFISITEKKLDNFASHTFLKKTKKENKKREVNLFYKAIWITHDLRLSKSNLYQLGPLNSTRTIVLLSAIDFFWAEHIERMNYIKETTNWKSYGQQNPLIEYNIEAFNSFKQMFEQIRSCMLYSFLNNPINYS